MENEDDVNIRFNIDQNKEKMRYLIEPREQRFVKDYKFLSYA